MASIVNAIFVLMFSKQLKNAIGISSSLFDLKVNISVGHGYARTGL